jgi:bifunctional DNase/RNase
MSPMPGPSILVLQPTEDVGKKQNGRVVPIWVGVSEATQLGIALEHVRFARPMTHDLFLDALTNLDSVVESVVIDDVQGPTFFAKLKLQHHGRTITLDARPSDAISLALREQAPLYMTEDVLEKASFPFLFNVNDEEEELEEFRDFISHIAPEDFNPSADGGASGTFRDINNLADLNIIDNIPDTPTQVEANEALWGASLEDDPADVGSEPTDPFGGEGEPPEGFDPSPGITEPE